MVLLVGVLSFLSYHISRIVRFRSAPRFEVYPLSGIEAQVRRLDNAIYRALLRLGVQVDGVTFKSIEERRAGENEWDFVTIEVRLPRPILIDTLEESFEKQFESVSSGIRLKARPLSPHSNTLDIYLGRFPTHRVIFVYIPERELKLSPVPVLPQVAIVVDDMGYDLHLANRFFSLKDVKSFSILPYSPYRFEIANAAHERGFDVLLHLPMEPLEYPKIDPGPGALLCSMTPGEFLDVLDKDLNNVPYIVGVNNHMGSRLTEDPERVRQIFTILKRRGLFFLDSRTTKKTKCREVARSLKLRFGEREVFLDHVLDTHAIQLQIKRLVNMAQTKGSAIGIAHPHEITYQVLKAELPEVKKHVALVSVSQLVKVSP